MAEAYALHEGEFGTAVVLELRANLLAHAHSEAQIAFWLGGARGTARVGSQLVEYGENVALGVNPFQAHDFAMQEGSHGAAVFLAFMVRQEWLQQRAAAANRAFRFAFPRIHIDAALRRTCWQVLDLILSAKSPPSHIDDQVEKLLEAAIDAAPEGGPKQTTGIRASLDYRLRLVIEHMRAHVSDKATIDEIAGKVGLSRAHLFALFRDQLSTTPQVFWSAVRVEEAMRRVGNGAPLTDVAMDLGFSAPSNFSRFFKEHTGVSPSIFRRALRGHAPTTVTGVPR
ncbi:AraC family transcriptional regulator [Pseudacidovorax intermedius]|uniref:AraC family transcriptional regulator n=1 Tax=Pseudacidovorax intermedius TaxID=433924 RepID=A0A147H5G0_9BURK|nr:AraC family transcriptional regulator [Pseudacidovorax intermedius]KTT25219.1 AraC family transcriptional regulator [Pseudacidovorax intermedius]